MNAESRQVNWLSPCEGLPDWHCKMTQKRTSGPVVVSVICPIFNAAAYLEETLDSVLAQDFRDFELLLINDGSSDSSGTIARRYAQRHSDQIRYFEHPENGNRGVGASRNLGIRHARGAFLAFIDSDDRWRPTKLREQLAIFDADPRVDLVAGTANYWRSWRGGEDRLVRSGHVQDTLIRPPEASLKIYPLAKASAPCPSDLLVRAKLARDIGGFEEGVYRTTHTVRRSGFSVESLSYGKRVLRRARVDRLPSAR